MCISNIPRNAIGRRPAHLWSQEVDMKSELVAPSLGDQSSMEPEAAPSSSAAGKKRHRHITVQHHYHDHAYDNRADYQEEHPARGGVTTPFPLKLHEMLISTAAEGMDHIVSWQPHGRCFLVHKPKEFVAMLPRYFKLSKLASFQRQLNLYGFQRLTRGRDRGGYYHEFFLRDRDFLAHSIQRIKVKGTGVRARSNPDQEPDFWAMPWINDDDESMIEDAHKLSPVSTMMVPQQQPQNMFYNNSKKLDDDIVLAFENQTFHYLDPYQQQPSQPESTIMEQPKPMVNLWSNVDDTILDQEAESFFKDFDFPENLVGAEIEDDAVFGSLLEQLISY